MKPPSNNDVEKSLIGCLIRDKKLIPSIIAEGGRGLFYSDKNALIFDAILNQADAGDIDVITIAARLPDISTIRTYLMDCMSLAPTPLLAPTYAQTLKDLYIKREILNVCHNTVYNIETPDILNQLEQAVRTVSKQLTKVAHTDFVDVVGDLWENYIANEGKEPDYMRTGLTDLDRVIDGIEKSDHVIIAGRPSMGKTALATDIVRAIAKQDKKICFFTMEMSEKALARRILCAEADISLKNFRNNKLDSEQKAKAKHMLNVIKRGMLQIYDERVTVSEIKSIVLQNEPDLVVVDYLQLMEVDRKGNMSTNDLVGDNIKGLQGIAKMGYGFITLSQLSRDSEKQKRKPGLADLYESGAIEAAGDKIIMPYREDKESSDAEILIVKQKDGPVGKVDVVFKKESASFRNLSRYN